jgi:tetratricopeptide (TPR) repeat protein
MMFYKIKALFLCFALFVSCAAVFGQTGEQDKLLSMTNMGVIQVIVSGKDKQEIARGTALVLTPTLAATSYHLISPGTAAVGLNAKKKDVDVDGVMGVDKTLDVAIIQIDGKVTPLTPGDFGSLTPGKKFYIVAANEAGDVVISEATVRKVYDLGGGVKIADTAANLADAITGGAAIDETGKVLGLVHVIEKRLRLIVPLTAVNAVPKAKKVTAFKAWQPEDYFATPESNWFLGRLYAWSDEAYNAQRNLEKVVKAQANNLEAWTLLAKGYDGMRDYQNAVPAYKKVIELNPQAADAYIGLGQIQARMQRSPEAIAALQKALELNPGAKEAYLALGEAYESARDFAKAGDAYEKYVAAGPADLLMAYQRLGSARTNAEQFDKAAAALAEAQKLQPRDLNILKNLAMAYQKAGKLQEAEDTYKKLAEVDPEKADNYYAWILKLYNDAQKPDKAIEAAKKIAELKPKDEQAVYNLGYMYLQTQKYQDALDSFNKSLLIKPNYDLALFQIGVCYYSMKKYADALPPFKKVTEIDPSNAYAWLYIGINNLLLKRFDAALDPLKKTVELQPDNANAWYNLGICYLNLRDNFSARDVVKRLQAIDPAKAKQLQSFIK